MNTIKILESTKRATIVILDHYEGKSTNYLEIYEIKTLDGDIKKLKNTLESNQLLQIGKIRIKHHLIKEINLQDFTVIESEFEETNLISDEHKKLYYSVKSLKLTFSDEIKRQEYENKDDFIKKNHISVIPSFTTVETNITSIYQSNLPELYFLKIVKVGVFESPTAYTLSLENPAFYEIMEILSNALISKSKVTLYKSGTHIQMVEGVSLSEAEKQRKVAATCLLIFENEIEFTNVSWEIYANLDNTKKMKFWKRWLRTRMRKLLFSGYDPYHMFHPNVYNFWQQQEPNIDFYLREFIRLRNLDQHQVETNLGRKL